MKKFIMFSITLLSSMFFYGCGEDIDIDLAQWSNEYKNHSIRYTKTGGITEIGADYVDLNIVRQRADEQEYVVVVESTCWPSDKSTSIDLSNCIIVPIEEKTDKTVRITGLKHSTDYYYFQVNSKDHFTLKEIGDKFGTFTTKQGIVEISSFHILGLYTIQIELNCFDTSLCGVCYSEVDPLPTYGTNSQVLIRDGEQWSPVIELDDRNGGKKIYCRPYCIEGGRLDGKIYYGDAILIDPQGFVKTSIKAIDLGLSVKWADRELFAAGPSPIRSDFYFQFGGISYNKKSWKKEEYNYFQNVELEDDAAAFHWGGKWRMPTEEEIEELETLPRIRASVDGVDGWYISGKANTPYANNTLFIPMGEYWSSTYLGHSEFMFYNVPIDEYDATTLLSSAGANLGTGISDTRWSLKIWPVQAN